ncbi:MAG: hypothetical protein DIU80_011495 [Chloroflexota bacterium]
MGETGIAAFFIALAVLIVVSGPARLLQMLRTLGGTLRGMRRPRRDREAPARD